MTLSSEELAKIHETNTGHAGINSLFSKAHSMDWDLDRDVNWDVEIDPEDPVMNTEWSVYGHTPSFKGLAPEVQAHLTRSELSRFLVNLQLGESVALDVCAKLARLSEREDHRNHAVAQAMDEARHHAAFVRFLQMLGDADWDGLDPFTVRLFDHLLESEDETELVMTEQFFLESLAMPAFESLAEHAKHPLLRDIASLIRRDESRHMGFGVLYAKQIQEKMTEDERLEFADRWVGRVLKAVQRGPDAEALTVERLQEVGADDPAGLAARLQGELAEVRAAEHAEASAGRRVPQLLASCRRAGLLAPELLEPLGLAENPLVQGALRGSLPLA